MRERVAAAAAATLSRRAMSLVDALLPLMAAVVGALSRTARIIIGNTQYVNHAISAIRAHLCHQDMAQCHGGAALQRQ